MEAEYRGAAELIVGDRNVPVEVHLSGQVEPLGGTYRWGGRIAAGAEVRELAAGRNRTVTLRTSAGYTAQATLGEQNPWGGCRVTGSGAPPFPVPTDPEDVTARPDH